MNGRGLIAMPPAAARETHRSRVDFRLAKWRPAKKVAESRNEPTISFTINKSYKTYTGISLANQAMCSPFSRKNGKSNDALLVARARDALRHTVIGAASGARDAGREMPEEKRDPKI